MASCGEPQSDDCVQVVRNMKTIQLPCTRNTCKSYTVSVPRQVTEQLPLTVRYIDYETRSKQVPYTMNRSEKRTRMETQKYFVPITTTNTRMVPVTKKVPKTIYVDITTQIPQNYSTTTMQTLERQVPVPYFVNIPETRYRTVTEQVPVQRTKVQMDTINKTVYDTQVRTRCIPETKMVATRIPVYNVLAKPAPQCLPGAPGGGDVISEFNRIDNDGDGMINNMEVAFDDTNANKDSKMSLGEYLDARAASSLGNTAGSGSESISSNVATFGSSTCYQD